MYLQAHRDVFRQIQSTLPRIMFHVINQLLSTHYHCPSIIAIVKSHEQLQENATELPTGIKGRRWSIFCRTFKHLSVSLTDCHSKRILIGNRLLHSLKGMAGSDRQNYILGMKIIFLYQEVSAAMQSEITAYKRCS
jgi:Txe/YoeB family toxin of Txe-Axe toxin-antitoxin module